MCAHLCQSELRITLQICSVALQGLGMLMEISCRMGGCLNSADILSLESFGQLMLISQPLEDRVKARTEGLVNYRSAWLGHGLLPGKKQECAPCCALSTALPLSHLASLILRPPGCWNKGWVLLSKEPLLIPALDYLGALSGTSRILSQGRKKKEKDRACGLCCLHV